jgi:hypothetical protein
LLLFPLLTDTNVNLSNVGAKTTNNNSEIGYIQKYPETTSLSLITTINGIMEKLLCSYIFNISLLQFYHILLVIWFLIIYINFIIYIIWYLYLNFTILHLHLFKVKNNY